MASWTQLRLTTQPENTDTCSQFLLDAGCAGVQVEDTTVRFDESEDATLLPRSEATITGYLNDVEDITGIREQVEWRLRQAEIIAAIAVEPIADTDWSTTWRDNFPPLPIGPFLIVPPWHELDASSVEDHIVIRIDPGLAFGTGQHPTTKLCLELLAQHVQAGNTVFDVGCGSGILSIAAAKLGARVTASDLDHFCVTATQENAGANDADIEIVKAPGAAWNDRQYDIVVANLMSALLIQLAEELAQVARHGGLLIVSGISEPRADEVEAALQSAGFRTLEKHIEDGEQRGNYIERWVAFVLEKAATQ